MNQKTKLFALLGNAAMAELEERILAVVPSPEEAQKYQQSLELKGYYSRVVPFIPELDQNHLIADHLINFWAWAQEDHEFVDDTDLVEQYMDEHDLDLGGTSYHCSEHAIESDAPMGCKDCSAPAKFIRHYG